MCQRSKNFKNKLSLIHTVSRHNQKDGDNNSAADGLEHKTESLVEKISTLRRNGSTLEAALAPAAMDCDRQRSAVSVA
jgi:hypothetical protein